MANTIYVLTSNGSFISCDELYHHGIKGMKWGVRRYQNEDGTLTEAGKKRQLKRVAGDKGTVITKGTTLYRVSDNSSSDTSNGKIYVSASKESGDFYINALGSSKICKTGKAYAHEYIAKTDLKLPDRKTLEKIELGLLNDKAVQKELIDSLMKKGMSREAATASVKPYSAGKAFCEKIGGVTFGALAGGIYGGLYGLAAGPMGGAFGAGVGAVGAGGLMLIAPSNERVRALNAARVSYGDKENKRINENLSKELAKRGYNAMRDYNDRRAYGEKGEHAVVVFESNKNIKSTKVSEITAKEYGKAYARNYMKEHPGSKLDFNDLVKDGEKKYKGLYEQGVLERKRGEINKLILEEDKKKNQ